MKPQVLILNGPNLNLLGYRQPDIYGNQRFEDYVEDLRIRLPEVEISYFQSNHEGELIDKLHAAQGLGVVLNPGAYTHTSLAIADAILSIQIPVVEVHISNIFAREPIRQKTLTAPVCRGIITGLGLIGYELAIRFLLRTAG